MSTFEKGFELETPVFKVGDVLSLQLLVGTPGSDGLPVLRPAIVAAVSDCLGEPTYEIVPASAGNDLAPRKTDIAARVRGADGSETPELRFVPDLGRMLLAGAPTDVLHDLLGRRLLCFGLLSHLHSLAVTMSQKPSFPKSNQMSHGR